jgi:hypothetical protein
MLFPISVTRGLLAAGFLAVTVSAKAAPVEIPAAANWISNPSFEEGEDNDPVDWVYILQHEKSTGLADQSAARSGQRGVSFQGEGGLSYGRWITPYRIPLEPGAKYRVSFWYRGKGADVYLDTQAAQLSESGQLTVDLAKTRKIPVAKPEPSEDWTFVEKEIAAPGYPVWAQLCLGGNGRDFCAFDDIHFERPGLTLVEPRWAQVVPEGAEVVLTVGAPELRKAAADAVTWESGESAIIKEARKNPEDGTWQLTVTPASSSDLQLEATVAGETLQLGLPKYFRVFPAGKERLFTFAAITDAHFYRKGNNERNEKFAKAVATLNALDPLFVLSLGDQMDIHSGFRDEQKKWIAEAVREQLGLLGMPVFTIAGNHEIDRTYEGSGTRWYQEKYLGQPRYWSFEVGDNLFAGIDVSTPGVATREHGASFLDPEQDAWLEQVLAEPRKVPVILAGHISPFGEWTARPDLDRFLSLLLGRKIGVYLSGHTHYTMDTAVANGQTAPPWPKPERLESAGQASAALADPDKTTLLTTTSVCAFAMGDTKMNGYRYLLVKDGRIAWQDVLPLSLSIERTEPQPGVVKFTVSNGDEKAIAGLPMLAMLPGKNVAVTVDGAPVDPVRQPSGSAGEIALVQVNVPLNSTKEILFTAAP